jgi:hypothetical protein
MQYFPQRNSLYYDAVVVMVVVVFVASEAWSQVTAAEGVHMDIYKNE